MNSRYLRDGYFPIGGSSIITVVEEGSCFNASSPVVSHLLGIDISEVVKVKVDSTADKQVELVHGRNHEPEKILIS